MYSAGTMIEKWSKNSLLLREKPNIRATTLEYGLAQAAYTATFWRILLRLTRNTPGILYLNPACFQYSNWILVNDSKCSINHTGHVLVTNDALDVLRRYRDHLWLEHLRIFPVVGQFATATRDARRHFWRVLLRILMNTSGMFRRIARYEYEYRQRDLPSSRTGFMQRR